MKCFAKYVNGASDNYEIWRVGQFLGDAEKRKKFKIAILTAIPGANIFQIFFTVFST